MAIVGESTKIVVTVEKDGKKRKFEFVGALACVFKSYGYIPPEIGEEIKIFGEIFRPFHMVRVGLFKKEIWWTSTQLRNYEDIAQFYYDNLLKQLPTGVNITRLKDCLKKAFKEKDITNGS